MHPQPGEAPRLELVVEPTSQRFDKTDDRWVGQVSALYENLRRDVGDVRVEDSPSPETKGATTDVILALGSSGALTAAVAVFKAWLAKDDARTRRLKLSWSEGEQHREKEIIGDHVDDEVFEELARAFLKASEPGS